ncbi:phage tail tape measure protein [Eubacterium maltosivorans]|uniref:Phage tail tape measure protein domain-containing protein n=1 Tax=Eubacterium maltosivorans TaxID=2041044 RepID=A0A4P9C9N4_EUBML|nr:phage tail tape measure protein [Eubacterium maltosivorans]QCT71521.1 hypothetical protein CPZ25_009345 [Eubacterium maltosivorans]
MAGSRIKGISIEFNGETKGLDKALKSVNDRAAKVGSELKDVERLLKFDPGNTELIAQKQKLLSDQIAITTEKLSQLKSAESQVEAQFKSGEIGAEQYRGFKREIEATESALNGYINQVTAMVSEQERLATNTKRLETLFKATDSSVEDFADVLGTRTVNAIRNGTASADQLDAAINKIGKAALGSDADLGKMKTALDQVDDGNSIDNVRQDLSKLSESANDTSEQLEDMGETLKGQALMDAADQLSGVGDKIIDIGKNAMETAMEFGNSQQSLQANLGLTADEAEALNGVVKSVFKEGITDSVEEATQAVVLTRQNFKDLNDTDLTNLTNQLLTLSTRTGTDMQENVRGTKQLMNAFGLTAEEAMNLVTAGYQNNLNASDDFMDTLNEYSPLFEEAGFSAEQMLQILKNGMDGGAMNTDKVADAVKELQIRLGDGTFEANMGNFSQATQDTFQEWKNGQATVADVAASIGADLQQMTPTEQQAALSALSSQFEDLGIDASVALFDIGDAFTDVNGKADEMDARSPGEKWQGSLNTLKTALGEIGEKLMIVFQPLLEMLSKVAEWFANLPGPIQTFIVVLGGALALFTLLMPLVASFGIVLTTLGGGLGVAGAAAGGASIGFGALSTSLLPIIGVVLAIVAAITAVILIIQNWGSICDWFSEKIGQLSSWWGETWKGISDTASSWISNAQGTIQGWGESLSNWASGVKESVQSKWSEMCQGVQTATSAAKEVNSSLWGALTSFMKGDTEGMKNNLMNIWNMLPGGIQEKLVNAYNVVRDKFNAIKDAVISPVQNVVDRVREFFGNIKDILSGELPFPKIKLPHFSVNGNFSLNPPSIPHFSVDWYAKGGILTKPTIFGANGNKLLGGGEAGPEAVAPISVLQDYVRMAVAESNDGILKALEKITAMLPFLGVTINYNEPVKSPAEQARQFENLMREFAK